MLDELEKTIAGALDRVINEHEPARGKADARWTRRIKERVCEIGHRRGFGVSADKCEGADTKGWLFDLVWTERQSNPERVIRIPLVMELEWDPHLDEILWDFQKLLVAKAPHKVMVFQQATTEKARNVTTILEDRINHFQSRLPKERYLLAGYAYDQGVYVYKSV